MDYLITEGYGNAARKFAKEANIHLAPLTDTIEERRAIKHAIFSGDIKEAIEQINKLNPEVSLPCTFLRSLPLHDYSSFMHHSYIFGCVMISTHTSVLSMIKSQFIYLGVPNALSTYADFSC